MKSIYLLILLAAHVASHNEHQAYSVASRGVDVREESLDSADDNGENEIGIDSEPDAGADQEDVEA